MLRPVIIATLLTGAMHAANTTDSLRWTSTATQGGGLALGSPITLTWSIVPDGLALPTSYASDPNPTSNLIARLDTLGNVPAGDRIPDLTLRPWFAVMQSALAIIASKTGVTYQYVADDGATWDSAGKSSVPTRGDVRIAGTSLSGPLGYNSYPNGGDMVLNTAGSTFASASTLQFIFTHEHAHGLGLGHVLVEGGGNNSMVSGSGGNSNGPQFDDLLALQRKYGDFFEKSGGNDTPATATPLGTVSPSVIVSKGTDIDDILISAAQTNIVSIDDDSDVDCFSFNIAQPLAVRITISPRGPGYSYLPEGGTTTAITASSLSDLSFSVRNSSASVIATVNASGAGNLETTNLDLTAGTYTVTVSGAADKTQFYSITVGPVALDSDADGIADSLEPAGDIDGDGLANYLDADADGDGIPDGAELTKGRDPWDRKLFFLFNDDGDPEGWTSDTHMGPVATSGGNLTGKTVQSDPKLTSPALRIDSVAAPIIAVRLRSDIGGGCQLYWNRIGSTTGFGVTPVPTISHPGGDGFITLFFDLSAHPDWVGKTITGLRFDPINKTGATIAIDRIWATDGDYDDDGWADADEPPGDADNDLVENWQDPDSDNDGIQDGAEIAKNRDPLDGVIFFGFDGDAEGWAASPHVGVPVVSSGMYNFTSTGNDPQLSRGGPVFSGDDIRGVIIRMRVPAASRADLFWGVTGSPGFTGDRRLTANFAGSSDYQWIFLDGSAHAQWGGQDIVTLRLDPTALDNASVSIDEILTSDGDYDDDGITDALEGTADVDQDGIPNLLDLDSDNDGVPDAIEYLYNRNPYAAGEDLVDSDGDGYNDSAEMTAGTDPDLASDRPQAALTTGPGLSIAGHAGRTYQLQRASASLDQWGDIETPVAATGEGVVSITDPLPPATRGFYRFAITLTAP